MSLANQFAAYTAWRSRLATYIAELQGWLTNNELSDAQTDLRLTQLLERLREDRLNVAFVAEFSRGKSELINAIFFADYGNRMLPSSAGRTTMCPNGRGFRSTPSRRKRCRTRCVMSAKQRA